jgi:tRNA1Val (adenine37-N6)-methyltransferase
MNEKECKPKRNKDMFVFNHFTIHHNLCAMKVGTDGVLLAGYAASIGNNDWYPRKILDIGCGSGLITMILTQRYSEYRLHVDAIDIDADAIRQTNKNLEQKPEWKDIISVHHLPIQEFTERYLESKTDDFYDLITCAPPYFISSLNKHTQDAMLRKGGVKRKVARHLVPECSMTLNDLFSCVSKLLDPKYGRFCFIFPSKDDPQVMHHLRQCGLNVIELMRIRDNPESQIIRHIYQCARKNEANITIEKDFSIYTKPVLKGIKEYLPAEKRRYTPEYVALLSEFCNHMFR